MKHTVTVALPVPPAQVAEHYPNYFAALTALGATPVAVAEGIDPAAFDGLLLPGGGDIDPARYAQDNRGSAHIDPALDAMQFAALNAFAKANKPVLGICRGHQLVNVYFGGTLIQHLAQSPAHSKATLSEPDRVHMTAAYSGSLVHALYGETFPVNSSHHQGVEVIGAGLRATQWSSDDVIEALEHERLPIFTVQWHPERMCLAHARPDTVDGSRILEHFIQTCKARA